MAQLWNVTTGTRLQTLIERTQVNILLPLANSVTADIELISGSIPTGTRLEDNILVGTVYEVAFDKTFTAVFRATTNDSFQDCTIEFVVTGPDSPNWQTSEGLLAVGSNSSLFILDNEIERIDFLKMDCEGAEYAILFNTPRSVFDKVYVISMEFHDMKNVKFTGNEIVKKLEENGFEIVKFEYERTGLDLNYGRIVGRKMLDNPLQS